MPLDTRWDSAMRRGKGTVATQFSVLLIVHLLSEAQGIRFSAAHPSATTHLPHPIVHHSRASHVETQDSNQVSEGAEVRPSWEVSTPPEVAGGLLQSSKAREPAADVGPDEQSLSHALIVSSPAPGRLVRPEHHGSISLADHDNEDRGVGMDGDQGDLVDVEDIHLPAVRPISADPAPVTSRGSEGAPTTGRSKEVPQGENKATVGAAAPLDLSATAVASVVTDQHHLAARHLPGHERLESAPGDEPLSMPPQVASVRPEAPAIGVGDGNSSIAKANFNFASLPPVLETFFNGTCSTQRTKAGLSMRDGIFLSERLKAVYVPNLKAGMLAIIQYLSAYGELKKLERVSPETVMSLISRGYKFFTFVRDPLSRLRSAYSETLFHTLRKPERNHARFMVLMKPGESQFNKFARSLKCCRGKFVKEIYHTDPQHLFIGSGGPINGTQMRGAPPFVFVGRIENLMERDWKTLLVDHLKLQEGEVLPIQKFHSSTDQSWSKNKRASAAKAASATVSTDSLEVQRIACQLYDLDYRCYGYPKPAACDPTELVQPPSGARHV